MGGGMQVILPVAADAVMSCAAFVFAPEDFTGSSISAAILACNFYLMHGCGVR